MEYVEPSQSCQILLKTRSDRYFCFVLFKMLKNKDTQLKEVNPIRHKADAIANTKDKNKSRNIMINGQDTHIPFNLPTAIIGDKGAGKSTLIKSIIEITHEHRIFKHIFFIYSSITWDDELPPYVTRVDINECETFLSMLFETKSIYNSYYKYFQSIDFEKLEELRDEDDKTIENEFMKHIENNIVKYNKDIINSSLSPRTKIDRIIDTGEKILKTFSKPFNIGSVHIDRLYPDDLDAVIIDDIAIAARVLFKSMKNSEIYEYFTLTRHMRIFLLLAGQQVDQIPKMIRREIMCWLFSKNTNLELLAGVITKGNIRRIETEQQKLSRYEFIVFNAVDGTISIC